VPKKKREEEGFAEERLEEVLAEEVSDASNTGERNEAGQDFGKTNGEYDALKAELTCERDKYLRLAAEYDNYRKRSQKEREALFSDVKSETITQLLPVYDNLERALKQKCSDEAYFKGIELIMNQLMEIFKKLGITMIPALGETFDPGLHNAVMHVEDQEAGENVIVEEFQRGFKLGDKVIRFSMVKVAN
jgi:molecular chaperone GrpE